MGTAEARIVCCSECGGDRGWIIPVGVDYRDGSLREEWRRCEACEGSGDRCVELKPVERDDDLEETIMTTTCSFCRREQRDVGFIVAVPDGPTICQHCAEDCAGLKHKKIGLIMGGSTCRGSVSVSLRKAPHITLSEVKAE